mmetsp:Transcript_34610/g.104360  ORF Transcript_34610/g.104360 Transcript_34610/m.104360 type:complete len:259 (+) Transcript_34610:466-1242(+)
MIGMSSRRKSRVPPKAPVSVLSADTAAGTDSSRSRAPGTTYAITAAEHHKSSAAAVGCAPHVMLVASALSSLAAAAAAAATTAVASQRSRAAAPAHAAPRDAGACQYAARYWEHSSIAARGCLPVASVAAAAVTAAAPSSSTASGEAPRVAPAPAASLNAATALPAAVAANPTGHDWSAPPAASSLSPSPSHLRHRHLKCRCCLRYCCGCTRIAGGRYEWVTSSPTAIGLHAKTAMLPPSRMDMQLGSQEWLSRAAAV